MAQPNGHSPLDPLLEQMIARQQLRGARWLDRARLICTVAYLALRVAFAWSTPLWAHVAYVVAALAFVVAGHWRLVRPPWIGTLVLDLPALLLFGYFMATG